MSTTVSDGKRAYSVSDVCHTLSIGRSTLFDLIRTKEILAVKVGRRTIIPVSSVDAYIERLVAAAGDQGD